MDIPESSDAVYKAQEKFEKAIKGGDAYMIELILMISLLFLSFSIIASSLSCSKGTFDA